MNLRPEWIAQAVSIIESGTARKLEKDNVTVYAIGESIIRIDIKREKEGDPE